jgi:hypothetical protein
MYILQRLSTGLLLYNIYSNKQHARARPRAARTAGSGCRGWTHAGHGGQADTHATYLLLHAMECRINI